MELSKADKLLSGFGQEWMNKLWHNHLERLGGAMNG